MAVLETFEKQPADVLDYDIDYTEWLPTNDTLDTVEYVVSPTGLNVETALIINSGTRVKLWVGGGVSGTTHKVEVTVTTVLGRVKQDEVKFRCKEY